MRRSTPRLSAGLFALASFLASCGGCGCSKGEAPARGAAAGAEKAAPGAAPSPAARVYQPSPASDATIAGRVRLDGDPPKMPAVIFDADPVCSGLHQGAKLVREEVVVNGNGALRNVLVYAKASSKAFEGTKFETPKSAVLLNQEGCTYKPHVLGVMVDQPITIRNSDETSHNIKCLPKKNTGFNLSQTKKGLEETRKFDTEEVAPPIRLECNVHPWMNGFCGVFSHPFFAVTGEDGTYTIAGLPPGEYEIVAWQESPKLDGPKTATVTVGPKESKTLDFTFKVK
ncbi:MAG TPA: carboxypeptidase regulatory-like domain-containing protein [Planctomycetota bacterium]|jgi:hypothetical protein|nr:carboxypeptidase regulatory-like domain-containing protein [Planctomycetota bacterium]